MAAQAAAGDIWELEIDAGHTAFQAADYPAAYGHYAAAFAACERDGCSGIRRDLSLLNLGVGDAYTGRFSEAAPLLQRAIQSLGAGPESHSRKVKILERVWSKNSISLKTRDIARLGFEGTRTARRAGR
jgi:hypothetical protein